MLGAVKLRRDGVLLSLILAAWAPSSARAQGVEACDDGGGEQRPIEVTPSVGALSVTTDAPISARYPAGYFGPLGPGDPASSLVSVWQCPAGTLCGVGCDAADGAPVPGFVQTLGDRLFFGADGGLSPRTTYGGVFRGVDGGIDLRFCTGGQPDAGPPQLGAFVDATRAEAGPGCRLPDGGHRIGLRFGAARDDGPAGSIEYLLYLTRGVGVDAPVLRDRFRNFAAEEITMTLLVTDEEAAQPVCVQAFALDGVGNVSEASEEQCVDPLTTAVFQPLCSVRPGARGASLGVVLVALASVGAAARRARSGRSRSRR